MKRRVPIDAARVKAELLMHYLAPVCERIEIAGSIRRGKPQVGDIELVAIPRIYESEERDLFGEVLGEPSDRIDQALEASIAGESRHCINGQPDPWLEKLNNGERYVKLHDRYLDIQIDLFLVRPPAEWGPIFAIRTGPAKFSQRLVTGLHVRKLKCQDGRVIETKTGKTIPCPTEKRFFKLCGLRWKEPEERR